MSVSTQREIASRDPHKYGEAILRMVETRSDCMTASQAADMMDKIGYQYKRFSDATRERHAHNYRVELAVRAARGDRYALSLLKGESLAEDPVD